MRKPRIFVASSRESLDVADAFNINLDYQAEVTVWKNGFALSQTTIDSLVKLAESVDFAIFIFTPDDIAVIREATQQVARDNVIYELGIFTGTLGKDRCFIVKPRDVDLHLPSDLLGLTPADYNGSRTDGNLEAAVNHPCALIKKRVAELGVVKEDLDIQKKQRRKLGYDYKLGDVEHRLLAKVLESYSRAPDGVAIWDAFDGINGVEEGILSLAVVQLERKGFLDKSIANNGHRDYFTFSITADGIDYLLENENLLREATRRARPALSTADNFDDDIPF